MHPGRSVVTILIPLLVIFTIFQGLLRCEFEVHRGKLARFLGGGSLLHRVRLSVP